MDVNRNYNQLLMMGIISMSTDTNLSIQDVNGVPSVAWALDNKTHRHPTLDEHKDKRTSICLLPNIDSTETLLRAFEAFDFPPVPSISASKTRRSGHAHICTQPNPDTILEAIGQKLTKTKVDRTKEALQTWISDAEDFETVPIADCMAIVRDLKSLISLLMYFYGACTVDVLLKNIGSGFAFLNSQIKGDPCYGLYLDKVKEDEIDILSLWDEGFPLLENALRNDDPSLLPVYIEDLCKDSINTMMRSAHPRILGDKVIAGSDDEGLGGAYFFWSDMTLNGKAAACQRCGNLFLRRRNTKKYCSKSCAELANRKLR